MFKNFYWLWVAIFAAVPLNILAEGSKQLTPNTGVIDITNPANTRSGFLEHDANFSTSGAVSKGF